MRTTSSLLLTLAAGAALLGCDRAERDVSVVPADRDVVVVPAERDVTVVPAERDVTVAQADPNTPSNSTRDLRDAASDARNAAGKAAGAIVDKTRDAAITTEVNAKLAGDPDLSALRINVDTVDGRVVLRGTAPDAAALDRAALLARSVDGVSSVSNELQLQR